MPGWAAIQLRSRVTKPVTTSWASSSRSVESEGDWPESLPSSSLSVWRWRLANRSIPYQKPPGWLATAGGAAGLEAKGQERIPRKTTMARRPGKYY